MKKNYLLRLLSYTKPYIGMILLSFVLAALINTADLLNPYITLIIIDDYILDPNTTLNILLLAGAYFATVLLGGVFQYVQVYILNLTGQRIMHNIRMELFTHLQYMSLSYYDGESSGRILTRATSDIEALNELFTNVIVSLVKDVILLAGIVFVMLRLNTKLALVSFSIVPLIVIVTILYNKKAKQNFKMVRSLSGRINGFLAENLSGMKLVQIFNRQKEKYAEFEELNREYNKASVFGVFLGSLFKPGSEFINSIAITIIIWYASGQVLTNALELGVLYAFINYIKKFFGPINDLADKYSTIQSGLVSAERIFDILDQKDKLEDMDSGIPLAANEVKGLIEFKNVWFSYDDKEWVLKDVSFTVLPGETVAFVGTTGSGKSTIINLLAGFYRIQKGVILLDGVDIYSLKLHDLRKSISVVMQDVFLFAGDINSNIRLDNEDISDEAIEEAARFVNADSFISQLPGGYKHEVTERGVTFSAGERQLLSFARAIAFNPTIIVLDEATASIDTENEKIIQDSLNRIAQTHTTLIIAHRLSTIKDADKIIILHKGKIRETGNHNQLMEQNGIYKGLYDLQFA